MSVAVDAVATRAFVLQPPNTFDFDITLVGTGANRQIIVWIVSVFNGATLPTVSAVAVDNTDNLSALGAAVSISNQRAVGWGGALSVGAGTKTIKITHDRGGQNVYMAAYAIAATGSDLINGYDGLTNTARPISLQIISPSGDLSTTAFNSNANGTPATNQTLQGSGAGGIQITGFDSKTTISGVDPTHTWTNIATGVDWSQAVLVGANFRAAAAAASQPPMSRAQQNMIVREAWLGAY